MITHELLKSKLACESQLSLFKETFPNGVEVTVEECVKYAQVFDFDWAAHNLLKEFLTYEEAKAPLRKAYVEAEAPLLETYEEAEAPLRKAYEEAEAPSGKAYEETEAPSWKAYEEARAPLLKAYKEAEAPLRKAYKEGIAIAFAEQYIKESMI